MSPHTVSALETHQAENLAIGLVVALLLVGLVLSLVIRAIVGKVVSVVIVVALAVFVWTQRAPIENAAKKCDATFLGVHLTPTNQDLKQRCQNLGQ